MQKRKFEDTITHVHVEERSARVRGEFIVEEVFPPKKKHVFDELGIERMDK